MTNRLKIKINGQTHDVTLAPNKAARDNPDRYETVHVDVKKILASWQISLFAHQWLGPSGEFKKAEDLPEDERDKRAAVENEIQNKMPLSMPLLGIGLMENVEIGSARAVFLTLAQYGVTSIPVHIPKSNRPDFKKYICASSEAGNVFFYIFLAIGLLASLTFAVTQGSRSSLQSLSEDRQQLIATETLAFADTIAKAATQLRLRGTALTQLSFANPFISAGAYGTYNNSPRNEIFNPRGGAVAYKAPQSGATISGTEDFAFLGSNEVDGIGRTCGGPDCSELILVLPNLRQEICLKINDILGVTNPSGAPPTDTNYDETGYFAPGATPFDYLHTIGDEDTALFGKSEGCFAETSETPDEYIYYKVLISQ